MPRKNTSSNSKEQPTISKFFTSAIKKKEVPTDVKDSFEIVKNSRKKKSSTNSNEDVLKNKKLRTSKDVANSNNSDVEMEEVITIPDKLSLGTRHTSISNKLKDFEYEEDDDPDRKRKIFQPRLRPTDDIVSNDKVEIINQVFSDSDDNDAESPSRYEPTFSLSTESSQSSQPSHKLADRIRRVVKYTPLEQQFMDIKAQYPDAVLFVECGYKYRFFGDDAEIASRILKIYCNKDHNFMTASIPVHRLFVHVRRIVAAGYKVGIVKQTETSHLKAAGTNKSGPFTRQLTALYTKATLIGEDVDPSHETEADCETYWQSNHYLMCLCEKQAESSATHCLGFVCVDPSTGEILYDEFTDSATYSELDARIAHLQPVEILIPSDTSQPLTDVIKGITALSERQDDRIRLEIMDNDAFDPTKAVTIVTQFYSNDKSKLQEALNLPKLVISCLAALSVYLRSFHLERVLTVTSNLKRFSQRRGHMYLNSKSLQSLEIFCNSYDGTEKGSLYWVLNHTSTKFGGRLLRKWLAQPLLAVGEIEARLDAVQELVNGNLCGLTNLQQMMTKLPDLERGLCSIFHKRCSVIEFCNVTRALEKVRKVLCELHIPVKSSLLQTLLSTIPEFLDDIAEFSSQINEKAARENNKSDLFTDLSKFPVISTRKAEIEKVESLIREHLREIRLTLKQPGLKYVTVMQTEFLVEVKNIQLTLVPSDWTLISSTKTVSRYHTPYLKEQYRKLNELGEQLLLDVNVCWQEFLDQFSTQFTRYQRAVAALATLDCLISLANTATQGSFCRPQVKDDRAHIEIQQGRHPIIDAINQGQEQFVPNDTSLDVDGQRVMVISGPNMGGKSSYIRQVALITIMAQMGSFVPAQATTLGVIDAVYTRMGASDEIFQGRSTFMVELQEAAEIMTQATERSLVILDELGRGTSTYDGVAIAHATLEYFIQKCKCLVLFVTHFPMMSEFLQIYPNHVQNFHMAFLLNEDDKDKNGVQPVTFLYQLSEGAAEKSYGLNVARLAEIPDSILSVAAQRSHELEKRVTERVWNHEAFASLYQAREQDIRLTIMKYALPKEI